jgi:predicted PurR-regulated permease PerM
VAVLLVYLLIILFISFLLYIIVPPLAKELTLLASEIPNYFQGRGLFASDNPTYIDILKSLEEITQSFGKRLSDFASDLFAGVTKVFGGFMATLLTLVISFYFAIQDNAIKNFLSSILPAQYQEKTLRIIVKSQNTLSRWIRGQLFLGLTIGTLTFIGLSIIGSSYKGTSYTLLLALIAGIGELVPIIGPIISAIPAVLIGFAINPLQGFSVLLLYFLIQQFENHILVPQVMRRATGLNPLVSLIALLIGAKLGGIVGILLAVPLTALLSEFLKENYGFDLTMKLNSK